MRLFFAALASLLTLPVASATELPVGPDATRPLAVGAEIPSAPLTTPAGTAVDLRELVRAQPSVIIVYRGGWCPFCNTHLGELAAIEPALAELGFRLIAFSPERPETLAAALAEHPAGPDRLVLSDRALQASRALGLAYEVPPAVQARYLEHGLDLAPLPDRPGRHGLPVPAAFVCDRAGRITFVYTHADIRKRVDPADLLAAARSSLR